MKNKKETYVSLYPLTIIKDRYSGCYSRGYFTAWNCDFDSIPRAVSAGDIECQDFWWKFHKGELKLKNEFHDPVHVGCGPTPHTAMVDLLKKINQ